MELRKISPTGSIEVSTRIHRSTGSNLKREQFWLSIGKATEEINMQQCGDCLKIYDESESARCPFCSDDDDHAPASSAD